MFSSKFKHINKLEWRTKVAVPYRGFFGAKIDNIVITQAEEIGDLAFYENSYTSVDLGNKMKRIGSYGIGYNDSSSTPTIVIPSTIENIENTAFWFLRNGKLIVKKAEGTISNAPWGIQNSTTIEYQG